MTDGITGKIIQTIKYIILIIHNYCQTYKNKEIYPLFYKVKLTQITKVDKKSSVKWSQSREQTGKILK